jgi:hypothetical protein
MPSCLFLPHCPDSDLQVDIPGEPPLVVSAPHARLLLLLTYEVSAAAKRDASGRNPKRRVFAAEGLRVWDAEARAPPVFERWAGAAEAEELEQRLARVRCELGLEMVAVGEGSCLVIAVSQARRWQSCGASSTPRKRWARSPRPGPLLTSAAAPERADRVHAHARPLRALRPTHHARTRTSRARAA